MNRRSADYHNRPQEAVPGNAPREAVSADFAGRLQSALSEKGWNQSDLARYASKQMPKNKKIGRDQISQYIRAVSIPRPVQLAAIAKALGKEPQDLLPNAPTAADKSLKSELKQLDDGTSWVRVNRALPTQAGIAVISITEGHYEAAAAMLKNLIDARNASDK